MINRPLTDVVYLIKRQEKPRSPFDKPFDPTYYGTHSNGWYRWPIEVPFIENPSEAQDIFDRLRKEKGYTYEITAWTIEQILESDVVYIVGREVVKGIFEFTHECGGWYPRTTGACKYSHRKDAEGLLSKARRQFPDSEIFSFTMAEIVKMS